MDIIKSKKEFIVYGPRSSTDFSIEKEDDGELYIRLDSQTEFLNFTMTKEAKQQLIEWIVDNEN